MKAGGPVVSACIEHKLVSCDVCMCAGVYVCVRVFEFVCICVYVLFPVIGLWMCASVCVCMSHTRCT